MAVEMAKLFFSGLSAASDMLSLAIFKGTALLLAVIFRVLQLPGQAISCVLCLIRQSVITALETILDIAREWLVSAVNTASVLITGTIATAVSSFLDIAKEQLELFVNTATEVFELASETGAKIASDLWKNFWEAVDFFIKYATSNK